VMGSTLRRWFKRVEEQRELLQLELHLIKAGKPLAQARQGTIGPERPGRLLPLLLP
jgi:hypothetical protein